MPGKNKSDGFIPRYRVLDLADEKGAYCGKLLGDLGADVIKVEPPGGDRTRFRGPFHKNEVHPEKSLHFLYFNTSKGSITLDIEDSTGQSIFKKLVEKADVVVESFPVGYLDSLGLGYRALRKINPRLVMTSITPYGQSGPQSGYKAADINILAMSGYMQLIGEPDQPPMMLGGEQTFYPAAQYATAGTLAALFYRDASSGRGQHVDVPMQEAMITFYHEQMPVAMWEKDKENVSRVGVMDAMVTPCGLYPCKDGWISMCIVTPQEWEGLSQWIYEVTGNEEILKEEYKGGLIARMPVRDMVNVLVIEFTDKLTARELFLEGQKRRLVVMPVNDVPSLLEDAQLNSRGFWVELDHPVVGKMKYPKGALYSDAIGAPRSAAPLLGADNERIYCNELGYSREDLAVLRTTGVI
ncbi:MAG TPA: CoA transferase [Dehalococcoidia bacterium]|nr:CoA transferase [Dehalococcoidia bacterium]